ncbi:MAG: hypothetical protein AB7Q00_00825 [Phycisphaerales bacterium]
MSRSVTIVAWIAAVLIAMVALGSVGASRFDSPEKISGVSQGLAVTQVCLERLVLAGWAPLLYVMAGLGLASPFRWFWRAASDRTAVHVCVGLTLSLTLSHGLGVMGVLGVTTSRVVVGAGLVLLAVDLVVRARHGRSASLPPLDAHDASASASRGPSPVGRLIVGMLGAVPLAILLLAATSRPGWLWNSEFGGFDAMSYHLQLPQEWLALGRIRPLDHNIYSYLPSYVESAFLHIGLLAGANTSVDEAGRMGLLAGDGLGVISAQIFHAMLTLQGAWMVARMVRRLLVMGKASVATSSAGAWMAGILFLSTPWTLVVGSLAYNEMAVLTLFAGACMTAIDAGLSPAARGIFAAILVGGACGAKPTALPFAGTAVAILLLGSLSPRVWLRAAIPGVIAGCLLLAPWMARNASASGNPVFPAMTSTFGLGHWTQEQAHRFEHAHQFSGSFVDRLSLLVTADDNDPATTASNPARAGARQGVHRGMLHPQWGAFWPLAFAGLVLGIVLARGRLFVLLLSAAFIAQVLIWLYATHIQSRFLLPLMVPGIGLIGLAYARIREIMDIDSGSARPSRDLLRAVLWVPIVVQCVIAVRVFAGQNAGRPLAAYFITPGEVVEARSKELNLHDARLALLGGTAPLFEPAGTMYNTTWDRWASLDPAALNSNQITHILIDWAEIDRLDRSGFAPPGVNVAEVRAFALHYAAALRDLDPAHTLITLDPRTIDAQSPAGVGTSRPLAP